MSGTNMFSVCGRMTALAGRGAEVIALLEEGARAGGDDCGLLTYSVNTALDDPDTVWVTELWTDKEAHDATTRSEPVATVTQRLVSLLAQQPAGFYGNAVYVQGRTPE